MDVSQSYLRPLSAPDLQLALAIRNPDPPFEHPEIGPGLRNGERDLVTERLAKRPSPSTHGEGRLDQTRLRGQCLGRKQQVPVPQVTQMQCDRFPRSAAVGGAAYPLEAVTKPSITPVTREVLFHSSFRQFVTELPGHKRIHSTC